MSVVEPGSSHSNLIQRVKDILLRPGDTWRVIDTEPASVGSLYKSYIIPLAAIPAVASFIGMMVFGLGIPGIAVFKPGIGFALGNAVVSYLLSLASVYILALIIDALAPTFGGQKNSIQALKVATYSYTAAWVAGIFSLFPPLSVLGLLGLYSFFLLYKGLPVLMKTPEEKAIPYVAVSIIAAIVVTMIIYFVVGQMTRFAAPSPFAARPAGEVQIGGKSVDLGELEAAAKKMERAAAQMEAAAAGKADGGGTVDPATFKGYLPDSVAGFARTGLSTESAGVGGLQGSTAKATYSKGDASLTLTVTDLGAMGALAALGSAFNVESSSEENGRYERVGKVDGRMTMEEYDSSSRHGSYGVMVGERFMVQAEGDGVSMDELKRAVAAVDPGRLEKLAAQ
ncbi:MAG: Yip1 family protein [Phenylobacterium sp.]|uniref:Yip1 family protein n=1 Tax=Phenylobacterium sp. TaxID=1871053 RepID=UPI002A2E58B2|nr:Yip1 family protein [Phenylobacterium sp.]MDD3836451.1 Yip1 family protein [Phenylobacterium sp.]MDX9998244.1 Yip1 family protein [Phenylobacterium sp.]